MLLITSSLIDRQYSLGFCFHTANPVLKVKKLIIITIFVCSSINLSAQVNERELKLGYIEYTQAPKRMLIEEKMKLISKELAKVELEIIQEKSKDLGVNKGGMTGQTGPGGQIEPPPQMSREMMQLYGIPPQSPKQLEEQMRQQGISFRKAAEKRRENLKKLLEEEWSQLEKEYQELWFERVAYIKQVEKEIKNKE